MSCNLFSSLRKGNGSRQGSSLASGALHTMTLILRILNIVLTYDGTSQDDKNRLKPNVCPALECIDGRQKL
jgi:hypothetical protein